MIYIWLKNTVYYFFIRFIISFAFSTLIQAIILAKCQQA